MEIQPTRCEWCAENPVYQKYHDLEWGVPLYDNRKLFEFLILEGAQAGLSWITVLKKRPRYIEVFDQFDPEIVARYDDHRVLQLMQDPGIIRNQLKIKSAISNAQAYLRLEQSGHGFSDYLWQFVHGTPIQNAFESMGNVPAETEISKAMSKKLKSDGFNFVGPTICYAFMQATGMVNDHLRSCYRYDQVVSMSN